MIRLKCPKCASVLSLPETEAGMVGTCSDCGQRFRVPVIAAKPHSSSPPSKLARPTRPVEEESAEPEKNQVDEEESAEPGKNDEDEEERAPARRKRKKKKKKKDLLDNFNPAHIVLVVVGLLVIGAATVFLLLIQRGYFKKAKPDQAQVLAKLKDIGAFVERDQKSPDQPVVSVTFSGLEFNAFVLNDLVAFPELRKLNLSATKTSDLTLEHLQELTSLRNLNLSHTKVTYGGMQFLKSLVNLEELNLTQTLVTDPSLQQLKGLSQLKKIYLGDTLANGLELQAAIPGLKIVK